MLFVCLFNSNTLFCEPANEEEFLMQYFWREVVTLPKNSRPKVGIVLGGGGARGLAHIGVLRVLEEEGFPIDVIAGTSVGALVGALYASGVSIDEIEQLTKNIGWSALADIPNISFMDKVNKLLVEWNIPVSLAPLIVYEKLFSTFTTDKMEVYLRNHIGDKDFHQMKIPFACAATDIKTGEKIIFYEGGDVALAVRASATIPGVFEPVEYRHRMLVDGGIVDNIPTDLAKLLGADIIIAVDISSDYTNFAKSNLLLTLNQAIYIQGALLAKDELKLADIVINPQVSDVAAYDLWRSQECQEAGIIAARKMIPELKKLVMERTFKWMLKSK